MSLLTKFKQLLIISVCFYLYSLIIILSYTFKINNKTQMADNLKQRLVNLDKKLLGQH